MVSVSRRLPLFQFSRGSVTPSGLTLEVREQRTVLSVHSGPDTVGHRLWWCTCHSVDSESVGDRVGEGREDTSDDPKPVLDWRLPRPGRTAGTARGGTRSLRGLVGDVTQDEGGNIKAGLHGPLFDYIQSTPTVNCGRSAWLHLWQSRLCAFVLTATSVVCEEETAACIAERMRKRRPAESVVVEAEGPWSCAGRAG